MRNLSLIILSLILTVFFPRVSLAETTLEKVARTGVLTAGSLTDSIPFVYVDDTGKLVGFSVDIIELIRDELAEELGKPITLEFVEVNPENRIAKITSSEIDIACDVSFTWNRDRFVDFSVNYGISGTKLLVKSDSNLGDIQSLVGKRIGVIPNTVHEEVIKLAQPQAIIVPIETVEQGFSFVSDGTIDGFVADGIFLDGFRQTLSNKDSFKIVPSRPYAKEGVGCIVGENNSKFLDIVNYTIVKLMQGYLIDDPNSVAIINRWFGSEGVITIKPEIIKEFFQQVVDSHEQIPFN